MANEMFRAHVTGVAFNLALGKTHIAALVYLEASIAANATADEYARDPRPPHLGNFTTGASGLITRGLVTHTEPSKNTDWANTPFTNFWQITPAGRLVLALLREAGIWHEYSPVPDQTGTDQ